MIRVVRFEPEHFRRLELQNAQVGTIIESSDYAETLAKAGPAFTALAGDEVIACGGCFEHHPDRAEVWTLISQHAGRHMVSLTRVISGWLQQTRHFRVEAVVSADFEAGHRWMRLLGFEAEGPVRRAFLVGCLDAVTYVRFRSE